MSLQSLRVTTLLRRHPWAEEVLDWRGVDVRRLDPSTTVEDLCAQHDLTPEGLERDVRSIDLPGQTSWPHEPWTDPDEPEVDLDEADDAAFVDDDDAAADEAWWDEYIDYDLTGRLH